MSARAESSLADNFAEPLKCVLFVEDDPDDFATARHQLVHFGLSTPIKHVKSGEELVAYLDCIDKGAEALEYPSQHFPHGSCGSRATGAGGTGWWEK